ncbi:hypothetical protein KY362_00370 [Candidatus Woesearchaeota archaeon]|nr:hypothetical protein [Candidatus Woesearchaeota archaeon]
MADNDDSQQTGSTPEYASESDLDRATLARLRKARKKQDSRRTLVDRKLLSRYGPGDGAAAPVAEAQSGLEASQGVSKQTTNAQVEAYYAQREQSIAEREANLAELERRLVVRSKRLDDFESGLEQRGIELAAQSAELEEKSAELEEKSAGVAEQYEDIAARLERLTAAETALEKERAGLESVREAGTFSDYASVEMVAGADSDDVDSPDDPIVATDETMDEGELADLLTRLQHEEGEAERTVSDARHRTAMLEAELGEAKAELEAYKGTVDQNRAEDLRYIAELEARCEGMDRGSRRLSADLEDAKKQVEETQETMESLFNNLREVREEAARYKLDSEKLVEVEADLERTATELRKTKADLVLESGRKTEAEAEAARYIGQLADHLGTPSAQERIAELEGELGELEALKVELGELRNRPVPPPALSLDSVGAGFEAIGAATEKIEASLRAQLDAEYAARWESEMQVVEQRQVEALGDVRKAERGAQAEMRQAHGSEVRELNAAADELRRQLAESEANYARVDAELKVLRTLETLATSDDDKDLAVGTFTEEDLLGVIVGSASEGLMLNEKSAKKLLSDLATGKLPDAPDVGGFFLLLQDSARVVLTAQEYIAENNKVLQKVYDQRIQLGEEIKHAIEQVADIQREQNVLYEVKSELREDDLFRRHEELEERSAELESQIDTYRARMSVLDRLIETAGEIGVRTENIVHGLGIGERRLRFFTAGIVDRYSDRLGTIGEGSEIVMLRLDRLFTHVIPEEESVDADDQGSFALYSLKGAAVGDSILEEHGSIDAYVSAAAECGDVANTVDLEKKRYAQEMTCEFREQADREGRLYIRTDIYAGMQSSGTRIASFYITDIDAEAGEDHLYRLAVISRSVSSMVAMDYGLFCMRRDVRTLRKLKGEWQGMMQELEGMKLARDTNGGAGS